MTRLTLTQLAWTPLGHGHCHHQFHLRDANLHVAAGEFVGLSGQTAVAKPAYCVAPTVSANLSSAKSTSTTTTSGNNHHAGVHSALP